MKRAYERESREDGSPLLLTPAVTYIHPNLKRSKPKFWPESNFQDTNWLVIGTLVPTDLFLTLGGFRMYEQGLWDWDFWTRCSQAGARVVKVPHAIYMAYYNANSEHHELQRTRDIYLKAYHEVRRANWPHLYPHEP